MGDLAAADCAVPETLLLVLIAHTAALATPLVGDTTTLRSEEAFDCLALLAHLATASPTLRSLVTERVPQLRAVGQVARAKRDAMRDIRAELARYGLFASAAATQRDTPPGDAAAALDRELAGFSDCLVGPLKDLDTSASPPDVVYVSDLAVELAFRTTLRDANVRLCSDEQFDQAYNQALGKHFTRSLAAPLPRFDCPRGVTTVEIMREARDAGFIDAERFAKVCQAYDAVTAAMRSMSALEDVIAFPFMPQRAADTGAAWAAFGRYVRHCLGCSGMETARWLLLQDAGQRIAYTALRKLQLNTRGTTEEAQQQQQQQQQHTTPAKRGALRQRSFFYLDDVSRILCGAFSLKPIDGDVRSMHAYNTDESSEDEQQEEDSSTDTWSDDSDDKEDAEHENEDGDDEED